MIVDVRLETFGDCLEVRFAAEVASFDACSLKIANTKSGENCQDSNHD